MIELYSTLRPNWVLHLLIISIFALIIQSLNYAVLSKRDRRKLFEVLVAIHLFIISNIFRNINGVISGYIIISNMYTVFRYVLAVAIIAVGIYNLSKNDKYYIKSAIILVVISLPFMGKLPYGIYTKFFILSLILLATRAFVSYGFYLKKLKTEITRNSIKEAFDNQHSGIIFAETNGRILLVNRQMLKLINNIRNQNSRNANNIWRTIEESGQVQEINEKSWRFHRSKIDFNGRTVLQIVATDITDQENINKKLEEYERQLKLQQLELKEALINLDELGKKEAISKSWEYIHGVMGQRISFLQRILKEGINLSIEEVEEVINELQEDLINIKDENIEEIYGGIVSSFESIGVKFHKRGELPAEKEIAQLFVEAIRECSNNAVRHGEAHNIYLNMSDQDVYLLRIRNDGKKPPENIVAGGGLNSLNKKVRELGGIFKIITMPEFLVEIEIKKINGGDK